jgi:hypothetical protein
VIKDGIIYRSCVAQSWKGRRTDENLACSTFFDFFFEFLERKKEKVQHKKD